MKKSLYMVSAIVLIAGLGGAALIYLTTDDYSDNVGYEIIDGQAYPINPEDSKTYMHDMEIYGGKANVIADEFMRWFDGLWHGKGLAYTVAFFAIFISLILVLYASHLLSDTGKKENSRPETG